MSPDSEEEGTQRRREDSVVVRRSEQISNTEKIHQ